MPDALTEGSSPSAAAGCPASIPAGAAWLTTFCAASTPRPPLPFAQPLGPAATSAPSSAPLSASASSISTASSSATFTSTAASFTSAAATTSSSAALSDPSASSLALRLPLAPALAPTCSSTGGAHSPSPSSRPGGPSSCPMSGSAEERSSGATSCGPVPLASTTTPCRACSDDSCGGGVPSDLRGSRLSFRG